MRKFLGQRAGVIAIIIASVCLISNIILIWNINYAGIKAPFLASVLAINPLENHVFLIINVFSEFLFSPINIFSIVFFLMFLYGGILHIKSKGKADHILKFAYLIIGLSVVFKLIVFILYFSTGMIEQLKPIDFILRLSVSLVLFFISYNIYFFLRDKETIEIDEKAHAIPISHIIRLIHFIFDYLLAILIFGPSIYWLLDEIGNVFITNNINTFIYFFSFILYYMASEVVFKSTPLKCLTGSRIVAYKLKEPSVGEYFSRTFSRLIPFEPLSFFGKKGWHDVISDTQVVKIKNQPKGIFFFIWAFLPFLFFSGLNFLEKQESLKTKKEKKDNLEIYNSIVNSAPSPKKVYADDYVIMNLVKVRGQNLSGIALVKQIKGDDIFLEFKETSENDINKAIEDFKDQKDDGEDIKFSLSKFRLFTSINLKDSYYTASIQQVFHNNLISVKKIQPILEGPHMDSLKVQFYFDRNIDSLDLYDSQGPISWIYNNNRQIDNQTQVNLCAHYPNSEASHATKLRVYIKNKTFEFYITGYERKIEILNVDP